MSKLTTDAIKAMPEYQELLARRRAITKPLVWLMLVSYFSFILLVGYAPSLLAIRLADGVTSVGIVLGLGLIFLTIGLTGFFVWYANKNIEDLVGRIHDRGQ